jgi:desulfoferrodoxin-like iron-binding protein
MTATQQVYSCGVCGQIVAVVHQGGGRLVCCGRPMMLAGEDETGPGHRAVLAVQQVPLCAAGGRTAGGVPVLPRALSVCGCDVLHTRVRVHRAGYSFDWIGAEHVGNRRKVNGKASGSLQV